MNKQQAIEAINNGATLHINKKTEKANICDGPSNQNIHSIRLSTAEQLGEQFRLHAVSGNVEIYGK